MGRPPIPDLKFEDRTLAGEKTMTIHVVTRDGTELGYIKWLNTRRSYIFNPMPGTTYNANALSEIGTAIELLMEARIKAAREKLKSQL